MKSVNIKIKLRRALDFLLTLLFFDNIRLFFSLLRIKKGTTSYVENVFLFRCARDGYGKGLIVEIGSYTGRSTICLALGSKAKRREKVCAIDPLEDLKIRELFIKNIQRTRVEDYITINYKKSEEAVRDFNSPIRLLFIDGSHKYEDAKKDILFWKHYLIEGGIIAMHDYLPKGHLSYLADVNRAVDEFIINSDDFIVEGHIDSILFASKKKSKNKQIFNRFNKFHNTRKYLKSLIDKSWLKCQ